MKVTVIGGGAMGGLFACLLSKNCSVSLIDTDAELVKNIKETGFILDRWDGSSSTYHLDVYQSPEGLGEQNLIILFVKSMFSRSALENCRCLIGKDTFILSMQNGMGHEKLLLEFVDQDHTVIGTTQHNASVISKGHNRHNGVGPSALCNISGNIEACSPIAELLTVSGIKTTISPDVRRMIWNKLFTNISASVLTGILQTRLGYVAEDPYAWEICCKLIAEGIAVAKADGFHFDLQEKINDVERVCKNTPDGITSIYFDLKNGRKTEVDTISGAVLTIAEEKGIAVPVTKTMVNLVHSMENRS